MIACLYPISWAHFWAHFFENRANPCSPMATIAHPSHKSKKALNRSITAIQGFVKDGAEGEIRTRTTVGHYPLKIACLPVPPLRHISYGVFFCGCSGLGVSPVVVGWDCLLFSAVGRGTVIGAVFAAGAFCSMGAGVSFKSLMTVPVLL